MPVNQLKAGFRNDIRSNNRTNESIQWFVRSNKFKTQLGSNKEKYNNIRRIGGAMLNQRV